MLSNSVTFFAIFELNHIAPIYAGNMPENILELTLPHVEIQDKVDGD